MEDVKEGRETQANLAEQHHRVDREEHKESGQSMIDRRKWRKCVMELRRLFEAFLYTYSECRIKPICIIYVIQIFCCISKIQNSSIRNHTTM